MCENMKLHWKNVNVHEKVEDKIGATSLEKGEEVTENAKRNLEKVGASSPRRQERRYQGDRGAATSGRWAGLAREPPGERGGVPRSAGPSSPRTRAPRSPGLLKGSKRHIRPKLFTLFHTSIFLTILKLSPTFSCQRPSPTFSHLLFPGAS